MTVIVFGSINVDHVAYVRRHPTIGETVFGEYAQFPGGKGANQAIAAARAGATVKMLGACGEDPGGEFMVATLRQEDIHTDAVQKVSSPTGVALITVSENSHNSIIVCPGANDLATLPPNNKISLGASDICLSQGEVPQAEVSKFFSYAKDARATTIFNPAPFREMPGDFLQTIDYLVLNEIEFSQFLNLKDPLAKTTDVIELLGRYNGGDLIVTLGSEGLVYKIGNNVGTINAPLVDAVDTVGAGDCFCGNFAAQLSASGHPKTALEYAVQAASISVTRKGAASSMPRKSEVASV